MKCLLPESLSLTLRFCTSNGSPIVRWPSLSVCVPAPLLVSVSFQLCDEPGRPMPSSWLGLVRIELPVRAGLPLASCSERAARTAW